jgi:general secretion pathway protein C
VADFLDQVETMAEAMAKQNMQRNAERLWQFVLALPLSFWRALVIVLALLWLVRSLADLFWLLMPEPELSGPDTLVHVESSGAVTPVYNVDLAAIQDTPVFGTAAEGAGELIETPQVSVAPGIEEGAAKTKLDLKLVGVLMSSQAEYSSATIARGSSQDLYQINDKMPVGNNVSLAKVLSDRVILDNNGNYESLWLYTEADFNVHQGSAASYPRPVVRDEPQAAEVGDDDGDENVVQSRIKASDVPESISDVVRFSVHRDDGQMVGFRIRPGKNRELFEQLGLQTNDIVTAVNGIPIDNAQAIRDNYQELKNASSADLEVKRGEETVYINVSLDTGG